MPLEYLISAAVTLFVVVDLIGLAPTFLSVTAGIPAAARRQEARRAAISAGMLLTGTALVGDWLLRQLGITLPAFRIAGGLLLFSIASEIVFGVRIERQSRDAEQAVEEHVRNIAAFPLATPLLAGPGALTATILLAGQAAAAAHRRPCGRLQRSQRSASGVPAPRPIERGLGTTGSVRRCRGSRACCWRLWRSNTSSTDCGRC
jgi:multiple antibiotic resistance protein